MPLASSTTHTPLGDKNTASGGEQKRSSWQGGVPRVAGGGGLLQHFTILSQHPANAEALKGLILQLAIKGDLTKNWRESRKLSGEVVEPAAVLLERIKAEKSRLEKAKKIPKDKNFDLISEDEISFELPDNWAWTRLGNYTHTFGQKKPDRDFEYIDVASIDNSKGIIVSDLNVLNPSEAPSRARKIVKRGCVIYSTVRPYLLNIAIVDRDFENEGIASTAFAILNPLLDCSEFYLFHVLRSGYFIEYVESCMKGVAYPAINDSNLLNGLIPIPPLEEQKAIVAVVNQLFAEVDELVNHTQKRVQLKADFATSALARLTASPATETAQEWAFLQPHFGTFFNEVENIKKLRETILQLAVQGKLTANWRAAHGPCLPPGGAAGGRGGIEHAADLLERIKAEKAKLVKAGQLKKEKPLPAITEDEIPYELPEGWVWCRFQDIVVNRDGERKPITKADRIKGTYDYYGASGVIDKVEGYLFDKDLLLIGEDGANLIARSTPIAFFARGKYWVNNHAHVLDSPFMEVLEYLEKYINAINLEDYITGMAQPKMPQKRMNLILIALPPIEEQKAIVQQVNALMALCDQLEKEIVTRTTTLEDWMKSWVGGGW